MNSKKLVAAIVLVTAIAMGVYYGVSANARAATESAQQTIATSQDAASPCCEGMKATFASETDTSGACSVKTAAQCPYLMSQGATLTSTDVVPCGSEIREGCPANGECRLKEQTPQATTTVASVDTVAE